MIVYLECRWNSQKASLKKACKDGIIKFFSFETMHGSQFAQCRKKRGINFGFEANFSERARIVLRDLQSNRNKIAKKLRRNLCLSVWETQQLCARGLIDMSFLHLFWCFAFRDFIEVFASRSKKTFSCWHLSIIWRNREHILQFIVVVCFVFEAFFSSIQTLSLLFQFRCRFVSSKVLNSNISFPPLALHTQ